MDEQSNNQVSVENASQQKKQSSSSSNSSTNSLQNSQKPTVLQPESKGLKWWMWLIIVVAVIGLVVGVYSIFV